MEPKLDNDPICVICGAALEGPFAGSEAEVCGLKCYERARYQEQQHEGRPYEEPRLLSSDVVEGEKK